MNPVRSKAGLLAIIDDEQAQWDALVASIPAGQMTATPVSGDWNFRDLTAHLLAWRDWGLDRLEAAANNQPEPSPPFPEPLETDDDINNWFHKRDLNRSAEDVTSAFSSSFNRLKQLVAGLSDADLADPAQFPNLEGEALGALIADRSFFDHLHDEHGPDIETLLKKTQSS